MRRVGIFGGTFDPPHRGHVAVAEACLAQAGLDEIWWIPNRQSPHKPLQHAASPTHRLALLNASLGDATPSLRSASTILTIELERPPPSYMLDTVKALQAEYNPPQQEATAFFLILGTDQIVQFHRWHGASELLERVTLVGYHRAIGTETRTTSHRLAEGLRQDKLIWVDAPEIDVSSTAIREAARENRPIDHLVSPSVGRYISQHHLYVTP